MQNIQPFYNVVHLFFKVFNNDQYKKNIYYHTGTLLD